MAEGTTAQAKPATTSRRHHAGFFVVVGLGFIALFIVGLLAQVQTSEAFIINSGQVTTYRPNLSLFMQIPDLFIGNPSPAEAAATIFGWGVELMFLGFVIGQEIMNDSVQKSGKQLATVFRFGTYIIILFNFWADYNYGIIGSGMWGHALFAALTSFGVGFFGVVGVSFLEQGWKRA